MLLQVVLDLVVRGRVVLIDEEVLVLLVLVERGNHLSRVGHQLGDRRPQVDRLLTTVTESA